MICKEKAANLVLAQELVAKECIRLYSYQLLLEQQRR
jgi:hypothetical protein